jgi:hypothetical protein
MHVRPEDCPIVVSVKLGYQEQRVTVPLGHLVPCPIKPCALECTLIYATRLPACIERDQSRLPDHLLRMSKRSKV